MNIKVIALGKLKEKFLKEGIDEFQKRLTPYASFEIIELTPVEIKDENLVQKILGIFTKEIKNIPKIFGNKKRKI